MTTKTEIVERIRTIEQELTSLRQLFLRIAYLQALIPFRIGDVVYNQNPQAWSLLEEIVADYSDDLLSFKSRFGNWFKVADFGIAPISMDETKQAVKSEDDHATV